MTTPTTAVTASSQESNQRAWEATLDRLEQDLEHGRALPGIRPGSDPGAVGGSAARRADARLHCSPAPTRSCVRQAEVKGSLRAALSANDRQRAFTDRVGLSSGTGLPAPAYVDFSA